MLAKTADFLLFWIKRRTAITDEVSMTHMTFEAIVV